MSDEELRRLLEQASHSKRDPRFATVQLEVEEAHGEAGAIRRTVKKRQCANCTCSLSRSTQSGSCPEPEKTPASRGGCGSCSLGDAFRCDRCPYRGMPAFKEGEEFKFEDGLNDL